MKKIILTAALASLLIVPAVGLAQIVETSCKAITVQDTCNKAGCNWDPINAACSGVLIKQASDIMNLINTVGNWMFAILMAVAAIFLIYGAFTWVTAGGNQENLTKARTMLINALIGVAIALLARGLVMVIRSILGA